MKPSTHPPRLRFDSLTVLLLLTLAVLMFSLGVYTGRKHSGEPPASRIDWPPASSH